MKFTMQPTNDPHDGNPNYSSLQWLAIGIISLAPVALVLTLIWQWIS